MNLWGQSPKAQKNEPLGTVPKSSNGGENMIHTRNEDNPKVNAAAVGYELRRLYMMNVSDDRGKKDKAFEELEKARKAFISSLKICNIAKKGDMSAKSSGIPRNKML